MLILSILSSLRCSLAACMVSNWWREEDELRKTRERQEKRKELQEKRKESNERLREVMRDCYSG